jgi:hypothetical protein
MLAYSDGAIAQKNATTLAAYKTLDICAVDSTTWRYSGVVAVYNEGAVATQGLIIDDIIQNKTGTMWINMYPALHVEGTVIPANGTYSDALKFPYSIDRAALPGYVRNVASVTIMNHSGSVGTAKGPEPKATFASIVQPCAPTGCTRSQGYWGAEKNNVMWPTGYNRTDPFYLSGQTWQMVMDTPAKGNGYYILAYQFIAATLNVASGAPVPTGIQDTLSLAATWLSSNIPGACTSSACGAQKDWGKVLETYNLGEYPNGPVHCPD